VNANPSYLGLGRAKGNSLGFRHNAGVVLGRMQPTALEPFKTGQNPEHISVAATKVDVIAHSMGGDIVRYMALFRGYTRGGFGEGLIHKLVTIDTPHLGSPIANHMLRSGLEDNSSLRSFLALGKDFIFNTVTLTTAGTVAGAVGDLSIGSSGLADISGSNEHPIPAAMVVGEYSNWGTLGPATVKGAVIRKLAGDSALVWSLTSSGWPALFNDDPSPSHPNDGMVSAKSQRSEAMTVVSPGQCVVHSDSLNTLGFDSVSVLDGQSTVPNKVMDLLNQPVTNGSVWVSIKP
jgi:hypothetical protein